MLPAAADCSTLAVPATGSDSKTGRAANPVGTACSCSYPGRVKRKGR